MTPRTCSKGRAIKARGIRSFLIVPAVSAWLAVTVLYRPPLQAEESPSPRRHPEGQTIVSEIKGNLRSCLECHQGIEDIREENSEMLAAIGQRSSAYGEVGQCLFCHGGTSPAPTADAAHTGAPEDLPPRTFLPAPASIWVGDQVCGQCHQDTIDTMLRSLMQTEAGKIQGTAWGFGALEGVEHRWANYDVVQFSDTPVGTEAYRVYIARLVEALPSVFPNQMEELPLPNMERVSEDPRQAAFTYIRTECQRCHIGVRGARQRGDWRGVGCAACHLPYSNEGYYEGADPQIPRDSPDMFLFIASSRRGRRWFGLVTPSTREFPSRHVRPATTVERGSASASRG